MFSWVLRLFGLEPPETKSALLAPVRKEQLVDVNGFRREERIARCNGVDPLEVLVAYAQDSLIYTPDNQIVEADPATYQTTRMDDRVNKFGLAYRAGTPLVLHKRLADVVVDAAIDLYNHQGWKLRIYDGLRTVDAAQMLYDNADPAWLEAGLLAAPGKSAHNRALAVDSSLVDAQGRETERFDNLDMTVNHRDYRGDAVSIPQLQARLIKEQAFQRAAIAHGLALAPLMSEYWDDRVPGSQKDLWRVVASLARCTGQMPPTKKAENYEEFTKAWKILNRDNALTRLFGVAAAEPPPADKLLFHELLEPIRDKDLPHAWQQAETGYLLEIQAS